MINVFKTVLFAGVASITMTELASAQANPYEMVPGTWAELPNGRNWGSTSTV